MKLEINDKNLFKMIKDQVNIIIQKNLREMIKQSIGDVIKSITREQYEKMVAEQLTKKIEIFLNKFDWQKSFTQLIRRDMSNRMNTLNGLYSNRNYFNEWAGEILKQLLKQKLIK